MRTWHCYHPCVSSGASGILFYFYPLTWGTCNSFKHIPFPITIKNMSQNKDMNQSNMLCRCNWGFLSQVCCGRSHLHEQCSCTDLNIHVHRQTRKNTLAETAEKTKRLLQLGLKKSAQKSLQIARWEANTARRIGWKRGCTTWKKVTGRG